MRAIKETGNRLICALDPYDGVGIIDSYFPDADFFIEPERFDRHLDKLRRMALLKKRLVDTKVDFVSICSPNYMHDSHIRLALRNDANAICEKPIVLNPWNLDALREIEKETGKKVYTILQLRLHPVIMALREKIRKGPKEKYIIWTCHTSHQGGIGITGHGREISQNRAELPPISGFIFSTCLHGSSETSDQIKYMS